MIALRWIPIAASSCESTERAALGTTRRENSLKMSLETLLAARDSPADVCTMLTSLKYPRTLLDTTGFLIKQVQSDTFDVELNRRGTGSSAGCLFVVQSALEKVLSLTDPSVQ